MNRVQFDQVHISARTSDTRLNVDPLVVMVLQKRLILDWDVWSRIGAFILAFVLGYWSSNPSLLLESSVPPAVSKTLQPPPAFLEQSKAMREFQALVVLSQRHPSDCSRILELPIIIPEVSISTPSSDASSAPWIRSFEILARGLEVAFSTERRLKLTFPVHTSRAKFCENPNHHLYCALDLWTSTCTKGPTTPGPSTVRFGIESNESQFFHTYYYGSASVARLPEPTSDSWPWTKSWLLDGGWSWERRWGAFWIRSQMMWFLWDVIWKGSEYSSTTAITQSPPHLTPAGKGCTISLVLDGDAQERAWREFARNNNKTYSWERIQAMVHHIIASHPNPDDCPSWSTVDVTIPSSHALLTESYPVSSTNTTVQLERRVWKSSTPSIPAKSSTLLQSEEILEYLSLCQYLIGSFAGSWFRVASSLNLARNMERFLVYEHRFWSLDIEWLKDL